METCVKSVLAQTLPELELILIDDGSTDGSGALADKLAKEDSRVKVIHQSNKGVSAARNAGLKVAQGEYIGFVDADDFIESETVDTLY
ncbi:MAG: glycosyltransferase, partial [Eubacteriales bacterium]